MLRRGLRCLSPKVAVIGSGPGGFYCAKDLVAKHPEVEVDVFEKLREPYGLVHWGVAPDHPEVKNADDTAYSVFEHDRVNWIGGVKVGQDLKMSQLAAHYHAVVLAYGAEDDARLGIPGEDLPGVFGAREFVEWYNSKPGCTDRDFGLGGMNSVAVIGAGNVALDVARMILAPEGHLEPFGVRPHVIKALENCPARDVHMLARRGLLQVSFTIKELRELVNLGKPKDLENRASAPNPYLDLVFKEEDVRVAREGLAEASKQRPRKRLSELILSASERELREGNKKMHFDVCRTPKEFLAGPDGKLSGIRVGVNGINEVGRPVPLDVEDEIIPCQGAFRSIGYTTVPLDDTAPFDSKLGLVGADGDGRVEHTCPSGARFYGAGWCRTGPTGVIVSTMSKAFQTAGSVLEDVAKGRLPSGPREGLQGVLSDIAAADPAHSHRTWEDFKKIGREDLAN